MIKYLKNKYQINTCQNVIIITFYSINFIVNFKFINYSYLKENTNEKNEILKCL